MTIPQRSFSSISSLHMLVKMLWNVSMVPGPEFLKISAERPSIPDALLMLVYLITFLTLSKGGRRSRSSIIAFLELQLELRGQQ